MVLTNLWMFNVEAEFDGPNKVCTFKKNLWRMPIEAITDIEITEKDGMISLELKFEF
jgi:hypothetical protein